MGHLLGSRATQSLSAPLCTLDRLIPAAGVALPGRGDLRKASASPPGAPCSCPSVRQDAGSGRQGSRGAGQGFSSASAALSALISGPEAGSSLPAAHRPPAAGIPLASARCRDSGCLRASPYPELPLGQQVGRGAVIAHTHPKKQTNLGGTGGARGGPILVHVSGPSNGARVGHPRLPEHQLKGGRERAICPSETAPNMEGIQTCPGHLFPWSKAIAHSGSRAL